MNLLSIENLTGKAGDKLLFEKISFGIDEGDKLAFVGINGCGKSTLLGMLAGLNPEFEGRISRKRGLLVSMLEQVPRFDPQATILEYLLQGDDPRVRLLRDYEALVARMHHDTDPRLHDRLADLMGEMDHLAAWDHEREFSGLLAELAIDDTSVKMGTLSGGMLKKVALARALTAESELLLLDEPTNHLDIRTIAWLEGYLVQLAKAVVLVTHDRYFLDRVCTGIIEIENGKIYRCQDGYSEYIDAKARREEETDKAQARLANTLRRELAWLRRGVKARTTKQQARIQRYGELAAQVEERAPVSAGFDTGYRRLGKQILELEGITKSYDGRLVIPPCTRAFRRGERLGLVGPNGSGKSTFLRLLSGQESPDAGTVTRGVNTAFGIFDQLSQKLDPEVRVLDYLRDQAEKIRLADGNVVEPGRLLERFLFPRQMFQEKLGKLSGGERRRLHLIRILLDNPNFLVFDEPTNDLDIQTLSLLEDFLLEFDGCLAVVSHDRYFLDRVADRLLVFGGDGAPLVEFPGDYSTYLQSLAAVETPAAPEKAAPAKAPAPEPRPRQGLSFSERKKMEKLLAEIGELEREKRELEAAFAAGIADRHEAEATGRRHAALVAALTTATGQWEALAERDA